MTRNGANLLTARTDSEPVKVQCRIELTYRSAGDARRVAASLRVDDGAFIATRVRGRTMSADAEADSPRGLLHTLEDYLACVSVAENVLRG